MPISFSLTEVFFMKIVVVKSPKFFTPFLRMIFKIGREDI
ncbi:MAG: stage V sporulation protein SpoVM [Oscillospiraceae bacterium]|nr:stage V sporulation protein SpoVM [Oscillospiraceae bacterium]MBQ6699645.1 stage V sporulation protein SpoVM [Oscillospiraceae bacterium]